MNTSPFYKHADLWAFVLTVAAGYVTTFVAPSRLLTPTEIALIFALGVIYVSIAIKGMGWAERHGAPGLMLPNPTLLKAIDKPQNGRRIPVRFSTFISASCAQFPRKEGVIA